MCTNMSSGSVSKDNNCDSGGGDFAIDFAVSGPSCELCRNATDQTTREAVIHLSSVPVLTDQIRTVLSKLPVATLEPSSERDIEVISATWPRRCKGGFLFVMFTISAEPFLPPATSVEPSMLKAK